MNIEQYRALKAQELEATANATTQPTQQQETTEVKTEQPPVTETKPEDKPDEHKPEETPALPDKINIDGVGEVTIEELQKGYLRQSDYTRKTQEVARKSKENEEALKLYETLKQNPDATKQLFPNGQVPANLDPTQAKVIELENKLYDMMLEREIETLQSKYEDFDVREVLETAQAKRITNLEDAYLLTKSNKQTTQPINTEELKKQIRKELLAELEKEKNATQSIISSGGTTEVIKDNSPKLTEAEKKVASMMKMSDVEYAKWRDADKKK